MGERCFQLPGIPRPNGCFYERVQRIGEGLLLGSEQKACMVNCFQEPVLSQLYTDQRPDGHPLKHVSSLQRSPQLHRGETVRLCVDEVSFSPCHPCQVGFCGSYVFWKLQRCCYCQRS